MTNLQSRVFLLGRRFNYFLVFSLTFRVYVNVSIYLKVLYLKNSCNEKPIFLFSNTYYLLNNWIKAMV